MKLTISPGNSKLGKIPNISLTPIVSCRPGVPCAKKCYALKAFRMYPNTVKAWNGNLEAYKENSEAYFYQIHKWLTKKEPEYFRWHVGGDIPDEQYWYSMIQMARVHPMVKFLVFTKYYELDFSYVPDNMSVVLSMWPGYKLPELGTSGSILPRAWCQDKTEDRIPVGAIECPGHCDTCGACWGLAKKKLDVVFNLH